MSILDNPEALLAHAQAQDDVSISSLSPYSPSPNLFVLERHWSARPLAEAAMRLR